VTAEAALAETPTGAVIEPLSSAAVAELVAGLLQEGTPVSLRVGGSSMAPFVRSGDLVRLAPARSAGLGDVVARLSGAERLLIHRVVGGRRSQPVTRGDAAREPDPAIRPGELLGRVESVERGGRRILIGLGPERLLLAGLSRAGCLRPLLVAARRARRGGSVAA